jgi:hypothetical protein
MSTICKNCGAKLSCGCQKRTASDKTSACSNCVNQVEKKLKLQSKPNVTTPITQTKSVWGADRYNSNK